MKASWKEMLVITAAIALAPMAGFAAEEGAAAGGDVAKTERPAHAEGDWKADREKMKNMSPEDREKFMQERKAKWDALSKEEKLKMIEERRKQREARWNAMSDDEKIEHVEKKMKRMEDRYNKKGGKHDGPKGDGPKGDGPKGGEE